MVVVTLADGDPLPEGLDRAAIERMLDAGTDDDLFLLEVTTGTDIVVDGQCVRVYAVGEGWLWSKPDV